MGYPCPNHLRHSYLLPRLYRKALVGKIIPKTEQIKHKCGDENHASGGGSRRKMGIGKGVVADSYGADD